jgi:Family of unknown function (DUF6370)
MKAMWKVLAGLTIALAALALVRVATAADKDEVELKGTITCAKCDLKEVKECQTAIVTKIDGKDATVYLVDSGADNKDHKKICQGSKKGTVKGVMQADKDGHKWIKVTEVKFD